MGQCRPSGGQQGLAGEKRLGCAGPAAPGCAAACQSRCGPVDHPSPLDIQAAEIHRLHDTHGDIIHSRSRPPGHFFRPHEPGLGCGRDKRYPGTPNRTGGFERVEQAEGPTGSVDDDGDKTEAVQGLGRIGDLPKTTLASLAREVKKPWAQIVAIAGDPELPVTGGPLFGQRRFPAGGFFCFRGAGYMSGDLRYHDARDVERRAGG